ncbi:MAG: peptidoglycan-binding protein [Solirubrobacteraceae bacterium]
MNRLAATLGLVIAIAVVIAIVLGTRSPSASGDHGSHNTASGATTVQRRDLVQTDTESGTLSYADSRTVYDGLSGTITWLPAVGQVIKPGQALYRVGGVPVILMNGSTPAYRDLKSSDTDGPDILELNRNLVALGFNPDGIVVDDVWQSATTAGVELFQESLGETETGELKLGNIVFLPHARVISAVDASLGSNGSGGSGSGNGNSAAVGHPAAGPEFVSLTTTATQPHKKKKKKKPHKPTTVAALLGLLKAQSAQLQAQSAELRAAQSGAKGGNNSNNKGGGSNGGGSNGNNNGGGGSRGGGSGGGGNGGDGSGSGSGSAVLETSSTRLVVTVDLDATKQSEAKVGEPVTVEMPGGNTVNGKVTAVSPIAQSSSNSGNGNSGNGGGGGGSGSGNGNSSSGATIPVTIALSGRTSGAGLDQAAVSVNFAQAEAMGVLSVPVTALLAVAGGNYAVQQAAAPHTLIPVTTGLFAAGYVQISGQGIYPGLAVTDSQG